MSEHVKPSRDDVARLIEPHLWSPTYPGFRRFGDHRPQEEILEEEREHIRKRADAVLALLPGRTEAEVKAEALREAADAMDADPEFRDPLRLKADWTRARADELERGAS